MATRLRNALSRTRGKLLRGNTVISCRVRLLSTRTPRPKNKFFSGNNRINLWMKRRPLFTSIMITGFKTIAADLVTQTIIEQKSMKDIDWTRTAVFGTFGFLQMGCLQYWMYNKLFFQLWPGVTFGQTLKKVMVDQFIYTPFMYFPIFYYLRAFLNERAINKQTLLYAKLTFKNNVMDDLRRFWCIWIPGMWVMFQVMPMHLRLPWIAGVSFFWVMILSYYSGDYHEDKDNIEL